jgi:signal transduction histidine kinase/HAMP domain-containing protein
MRERILAATGWLPRLIARIPASVHAKLLLAFLATAALLIILGGVGLKVLSGVNSRAEDLVKRQERIGAYRQFQHDVSLPSSWSWNERTLSATLAQLNQFRYEFDQLQVVAMDDTDRLGRVRDDYEQLTAAVGQVVELIDAGASVESQKRALLKASALADRLDRLTNELVNRAEADLVTRMDASQAAYATSRSVVIGFAVGSLALALVLGYAISWSLIGPVQLMDARLRRVASGDFSQRLDVPNRDELGVLARQFNQMTAQLQGSYAALEEKTGALGRAVEELTALGEVSRAVSSTLDLETVLETIVARSVHISSTAGGSIYEYNEGSDTLHLRATYNMDAELVELLRAEPIGLGEGSAGKAAATRAPVQIADIRDDTLYDVSRLRGPLGRHGYCALLSVPLFLEQRVLGALTVWRRQPGSFTPEVVNLLQTFATHSALALQNARLFQELADKSRQLEQASQHKSHFLASMSHELRTPLNAILGFNEMMLDGLCGEVPQGFKDPLQETQTSGKHLLRLINNVLDLAKIEAGRMELTLADYVVQDMVESVRSTLRPLAEAKGLEFRVHVSADLPLTRGDVGRLTQCLMNLAGNSLKFTKEGHVEISVEPKGESLVFRVVDTGIGISPDKIGSLFTDFTQTDATIASEYGGTGLGLSITKKFIEMHGGYIWVESEPSKGSTFIFEVPQRAKAT